MEGCFKKEKKIIPIFENEEDIPTLVETKLGVPFKKDDIQGISNKIYSLILKKLNIT